MELSWKGLPLIKQLLRGRVLRAWATHPYKQVREEVGSLLALAMHAAEPPPHACPELACELHAETTAFLQHLIVQCALPAGWGEGQGELSSSGSADLALEPENEGERGSARAARECLIKVITFSMLQASHVVCEREVFSRVGASLAPHFPSLFLLGAQGRAQVLVRHLPLLLPVVLLTAASNQQPDLSNAAKSCSVLLAHFSLESSLLSSLLVQVQGKLWLYHPHHYVVTVTNRLKPICCCPSLGSFVASSAATLGICEAPSSYRCRHAQTS